MPAAVEDLAMGKDADTDKRDAVWAAGYIYRLLTEQAKELGLDGFMIVVEKDSGQHAHSTVAMAYHNPSNLTVLSNLNEGILKALEIAKAEQITRN